MSNGNKTKKTYIIKAVNSDTDTCSCCGRTNLKKVAWVSMVVDGIENDPAPFGTTCAAKAIVKPKHTEVTADNMDEAISEAHDMRSVKEAIKRAGKTKKPVRVFQ